MGPMRGEQLGLVCIELSLLCGVWLSSCLALVGFQVHGVRGLVAGGRSGVVKLSRVHEPCEPLPCQGPLGGVGVT
jgi:hypothetical protein